MTIDQRKVWNFIEILQNVCFYSGSSYTTDTSENDLYYKMDHLQRGIAIILNHYEYESGVSSKPTIYY